MVDAARALFPAIWRTAADVGRLVPLMLAEELLVVGGTPVQHFVGLSPDPSPVGKHNFFFFTSAHVVVGEVEK